MHVVHPIIAMAAITGQAACEINPHRHAVRPSDAPTRPHVINDAQPQKWCDATHSKSSVHGGATSRLRARCRMVTSTLGEWRRGESGRAPGATLSDDLPYDGVELFVATAAGRRCVRAGVCGSTLHPDGCRSVLPGVSDRRFGNARPAWHLRADLNAASKVVASCVMNTPEHHGEGPPVTLSDCVVLLRPWNLLRRELHGRSSDGPGDPAVQQPGALVGRRCTLQH